MLKHSWIVGVALLAVGSAACGKLGKKAPIASNNDLRREYKTSEATFRAKYDGKDIALYGTADKVDLTGSLGIVRLTEGEADLYGVPSFRCNVDKADMARFTQLNVAKGTMVRLKGAVKIDGETIEMNHCTLDRIGTSALADD